MPPSFFKPSNAAALAATIAAVCAKAPALPCYYYHIPSMDGVDINMLDFVQAVDPLSPNFAGIKYTGMYAYPGMPGAQEVMAYKGGKYEVLCGREEMMLEALAIGIKGFVGSQFNVAGDLCNAIHSKFMSQGLTPASQAELRALQLRVLALLSAWQGKGTPGSNNFKNFAVLSGVAVGDARLPSLPLDAPTRAALRKAFDDFCASELGGKGLHMCGSTTAPTRALA